MPVGPTAAAVNEVDAAFERIKQSLAFCQAIPKKSLEPRPRNEPAAFAVLGLSTMDDRGLRERETSFAELEYMNKDNYVLIICGN